MRWMGMNEQRARLRIEILFPRFVLRFWRAPATTVRETEAHARWCVYNRAVIKLIYDEKTRDRVADNFYHLNGYLETMKTLKQFKSLETWILIRRARPIQTLTWRADFKTTH